MPLLLLMMVLMVLMVLLVLLLITMAMMRRLAGPGVAYFAAAVPAVAVLRLLALVMRACVRV